MVTKSNKLISANYDLSLQEQKIILTLASMVQPQDTEFKEYEFKIKDFIQLLDVKDEKKYIEVPKLTKDLMKKVFEIREGKDILQLSWLSSARYKTGEGTLILKFAPDLKAYMLELKELYTSYRLENVLSLKSKYSIRLYEVLKSNAFKRQVAIELEELKSMVGAKEKAYNTYANFKNKALIQAQKELKDKTDISFEFEELKTGRKVTSLKFYIKTNKVSGNEKSISISENTKGSFDIENGIKEIMKMMQPHKTSEKDALAIYKNAEGDVQYIYKVYDYSKTQDIKKSLIGFMKEMVKPGVLQEAIRTRKTTTFNNFPQRTYDFDELERKLLGWHNEEEA